MKITRKSLSDTVTVKIRGKWQNISLFLFDRLYHRQELIWINSDDCFVGITG